MTELYSASYVGEQKRLYKKRLLLCAATAVSVLFVCVLLCFFVNTKTANVLYFVTIGLSIPAGWVYLLYLRPRRKSARAEYTHCENIFSKTDSELHSGVLSVSKQKIQVPGSIQVRSVRLTSGEETHFFHLNAAFTLPADGTHVTLRTVNNYVTACEVNEDA